MGSTELTPLEALRALAPLIGAGGISGIIIAVIAYLKASREGRRGDPDRAGLGISAILADSESIRLLASELGRGSDAFEKNATAVAALVLGFADARPHLVNALREIIEGHRDMTEAQDNFRRELVEELRKIRHVLEEQQHGSKPRR